MSVALAVGGLAVASYLDAKYHLRRDLRSFYKLVRNRKAFEKVEAQNRASPWYLLQDACKKYPNNRAIWSRQGCYTFAEFYDRVAQYAQWFLEQGVQPGQYVATYQQNSPEFMMVWYALLCVGAAPAFINYNLENKALLHCLNVAEAKLLVVDPDEKCRQRIEDSREEIERGGMHIRFLDDALRESITSRPVVVPGDEHRSKVKGDDPLCMIYTSGTTGLPKGCPFLVSRFHILGGHLEPSFESVPGNDVWYNSMPLYHGTGGINSALGLISGINIAIGQKFSASKFWNDIHDSGATMFIYVGETARYLLNAPHHPLERDHRLRCAYGNGLRPDVWKRFQDRFNVPTIYEFFSSSEGMLSMIVNAKGDYLRGTVGHHGLFFRLLLRNTFVPVKIDHETGDIYRDPKTGFAQRSPYEEGGEILVNIPDPDAIEFKGYHRSETATAKKFCKDVFQKGDLWYRSGDALRRSPDGHWTFMDRLGDTYRWKSENVSTAEVSEVLGHYPGIAEANVYGVLVPGHEGRAGCAAIHIDPNHKGELNYNDLLSYSRARLPRYAVPVFLRIATASSHIHNHKQNKVPLRKEGVDPNMAGKEDPAGKNDKFLWVKPKGDEYVAFGEKEWNELQGGKHKL